ncbi:MULTISPECIES: type IV pilus modification protein PilV [Pseudoxanthomonas]|uniref:type IV pilus modification protein PilV n=1 Tax=Pseudoxanthomonas TaxID=83618 RepID=UPI001E34D3A2|nr:MULTISPECIES: type IV pilus modification protein PilV [Pseudoxanthomonas]
MFSVPYHVARRGRSSTSFRERGVGIVEVLVSVVVLSIGLLGVAAMQSVALRGGQSSLETSQAVIQTTSILESMRANSGNSNAYNTGGMVCTAGAAGTLAQNDLRDWVNELKATMGTPGDTTTCGQIRGCPANCVITVRWNDQRAGGNAAREIETRSAI